MHGFALAAARLLTRVAALFLLAMMALNVVDVGLRSGFNAPIFGTYEIIEFLLAAVAFLAIPEVFLRDQHITIELIDQVIPEQAVRWLKLIGTFVALVFVALLTWHMTQPAREFVQFNDVTIDLHLPIIWKAALVLAGFAAAAVAVAVMFLRELSALGGRAG
ncbi:MAG: TRAP transporter small permease subunit [Defluviicoccus sp.]|nr:TRAP transporter small permease subunit [Defluviicoccus sp.]